MSKILVVCFIQRPFLESFQTSPNRDSGKQTGSSTSTSIRAKFIQPLYETPSSKRLDIYWEYNDFIGRTWKHKWKSNFYLFDWNIQMREIDYFYGKRSRDMWIFFQVISFFLVFFIVKLVGLLLSIITNIGTHYFSYLTFSRPHGVNFLILFMYIMGKFTQCGQEK